MAMIRQKILMATVLATVTLFVFLPVRKHEFINYDDGDYITENPHVIAGFTASSVVWAFTATRSSNWHPLTWLSHMLDVQLYGMDAGKHHLTSLFLHLTSTLLLFGVLAAMTGALWRSAVAAAFFAVHPLHVESVAWVAERKDVLSGFFCMLTIGAYWLYTRKPGGGRYGVVTVFFALGLMAKPMLVTLPFILLLLDVWPLRRLAWANARISSPSLSLRIVILEKLPLLLLSAISSIVTYWAQQVGGSISTIHLQQFGIRFGNALLSYVTYLGKAIWPVRLAVFYPLPTGSLPPWKVAGAGLLIAAITIAVVSLIRRRPYLATNWLWFFGMLVPVIGLIQVGEQSMADRYMYLPLIGLSVMTVWCLADIATHLRIGNSATGCVIALWLAVLIVIGRAQVNYWQDSMTLFGRTLAVTEGNYIAHANLGRALLNSGRIDESIDHFRKSLSITPLSSVLNNLGTALMIQGRPGEALAQLNRALLIEPSAPVLTNIGLLLYEQGDLLGAVARYREAVQLEADNALAYNNLGAVLWDLGERREAMAAYLTAMRLQPDYISPIINMGDALLAEGRQAEAEELYRSALRLDPANAAARAGLAKAFGGAP